MDVKMYAQIRAYKLTIYQLDDTKVNQESPANGSSPGTMATGAPI